PDFRKEHQVIVIFSLGKSHLAVSVRKKEKIYQRKNIQHKQNRSCCLYFLLSLSIQFSDLFYLYLKPALQAGHVFSAKQAAPQTEPLRPLLSRAARIIKM